MLIIINDMDMRNKRYLSIDRGIRSLHPQFPKQNIDFKPFLTLFYANFALFSVFSRKDGLGLALRFFVFERVAVHNTSMYPTLNDGEQLIVLKINYIFGKPKREDIAIIRIDSSEKYVKRVIAMPGETIQITGNKVYPEFERFQPLNHALTRL